MRAGLAALWLLGSAAVAPAADLPRLEITTEIGAIEIEVDTERAPVTAANFLRYVDAGLFRGTRFYRVVHLDNDPHKTIKIEVIQGGRGAAADVTGFAPVPHEDTGTTGILHRDGTVSMARLEPGSASSEFFICVGDQPELDRGGRRNPDGAGFAAFGRVVRGMDIVRRIHQSRHTGQSLAPTITVHDIHRSSRR